VFFDVLIDAALASILERENSLVKWILAIDYAVFQINSGK